MSGAPTINDVARVAGVGKTSVSRYLNGETAALSPVLKGRIEAAIAALSYRPNQMARGLKRGRTRLIGILVADLRNPYSVDVIQGIEAACRQLGLMPMLCNAANEVELEGRYLDLLRTYRAEGLIVNPVGMSESTLQTIAEGGIPMVLLDRVVEGIECDSVGLDNHGASRLLVDHLADAGFDTLLFVSEAIGAVSSRREREAAVMEGARRRGMSARTLVVDLAQAASISAVIETVTAINRDGMPPETHATSHGKTGRVAVVTANGQTMLALSVALSFQPLPALGMASFDDPEWIALAEPGVTTLRQPTFDIGATAVHFLNERIDGSTVPRRTRAFDAELITRRSTLPKTPG
jgi:LacI family kdg operon repressor